MRRIPALNPFAAATMEWLFFSSLALLCFGLFMLLIPSAWRKLVVFLSAAICGATLVLQIMSPIGISTDYYRYVWQGRVSNANLSNYTLTPWSPGTEQANVDLFEYMDWRDVTSVYPPLAEEFFRLPAAIFDADPLGQSSLGARLSLSRLPNLFIFLVSAWLLYRLTKRPIVAFIWLAFPLTQFELLNSAHVDALSIAFILGAMLGLKSRLWWSHMAAGFLLACAGMVKLSPFLLIPLALLYLLARYPLKNAFAFLAAALGLTSLYIEPFLRDDFALVGRMRYWLSGSEFSIGNPIYELALLLPAGIGQNLLQVVAGVLCMALFGVATRSTLHRKLTYTTFLNYSLALSLIPFLASPIVLPWYWMTPLALVLIMLATAKPKPSIKATIFFGCSLLAPGGLLLTLQYVDRAISLDQDMRWAMVTAAATCFYGLIFAWFMLYRRKNFHGGVNAT
jgi:hypothetical protein